MAAQALRSPDAGRPSSLAKIIIGSAAGTMIEWYDFYIVGALTAVLATRFYPPGNDTFALIAYLATFGVGFVVRPFGALFFGRIGDLIGRRVAFIVTLAIMGFSTALIGLLPTFRTAGWFSPIMLILIRVLQGLAIGGEYGGAAIYVAEHVPENRRGFYTSFIQVTASLGMFISLAAVIATQQSMTTAAFEQWGWRLPFLFSLVLVGLSLYVRFRMNESPIFRQLKSAGMHSLQPLKDAFTQWSNLKQVLLSLFGALAGQGVVSYTAQFYALFYLQNILRVNLRTSNILVAIGLLLGAPFVPVFGALSDRVGRKKIIMAGLLIAVFTLIPIYRGMQQAAGNNVVAVSSIKDRVTGDIHLTPLTREESTGRLVPAPEASSANGPVLVLLIFFQVILAGLVYGPIAAYLVEAFPAKVRYTSISLPYHIGNGIFGGVLPFLGLLICASTGNIYAGLYYPIAVAAITFVVGSALLKETNGTLLWQEFQPITEPVA